MYTLICTDLWRMQHFAGWHTHWSLRGNAALAFRRGLAAFTGNKQKWAMISIDFNNNSSYLQTKHDLEKLIDAINAGRPQCPVGLNTLVIPRKVNISDQVNQPYVYLNCGHVQGLLTKHLIDNFVLKTTNRFSNRSSWLGSGWEYWCSPLSYVPRIGACCYLVYGPRAGLLCGCGCTHIRIQSMWTHGDWKNCQVRTIHMSNYPKKEIILKWLFVYIQVLGKCGNTARN